MPSIPKTKDKNAKQRKAPYALRDLHDEMGVMNCDGEEGGEAQDDVI